MVATLNLRPDPSVLADVPLFAGIDAPGREDVLATAHIRRIAKGDPVFEQGAPASAFFVLLDGHVKAVQTTPTGQQVVVHVVKPGEFFGCVALMGARHYPATAFAVQESLALTWNVAALKRLVERHPSIATNALVGMGARMSDMRARFRELSTERVERRIAHALLRLARHSGRKIEDGVEIDFPITRQDIADMTGATLHTVSRTLSKWEADGLLDGGRRRIVIRQPHRLVAIAEELGDR
jgi:CRP/FNR family transcriptional regulator, nitrogen oxide reductase regulator